MTDLRKWMKFSALAVFFFMLAFCGVSAEAQALYGSITGTITDATGAVIPNAAVVLTNQGTSAVQTVNADGQGLFSILNLLPGNYTVSVARSASFGSYTQKDIPVEVNRE